MPKRLLFVMPHLYTGGITTAFLNLINAIHKNSLYKIDVLLFNQENVTLLPDDVNVLPANAALRLIATPQSVINKESIFLALLRYFFGAISKVFGSNIAYWLIFLFCPTLSGYDAAISYCQSSANNSFYGGMNEFVISKVAAKNKITFLHCDYSCCGSSDKHNNKIYDKFDKIAAVSQGVKDAFVSILPHLESKVFVVHNCHQVDKILALSKNNTVFYDDEVFNIITVARISAEKGHYRALDVFKRLKEEGYNFKWHIIGGSDASSEEKLQKLIVDYGLMDYVVMHGDQDNPYKFFVNADILFLPSYHEAAPMVFSEAEILALPVLCTDTISAKEFVEDRLIGIVCENNIEGIYSALTAILENVNFTAERKKMFNNMEQFSNYNSVQEFMQLIE